MESGAHPGQVHCVGGALQQVAASAGCYTSACSLHTPAAVSGLNFRAYCPRQHYVRAPRMGSPPATQAQDEFPHRALPAPGLIVCEGISISGALEYPRGVCAGMTALDEGAPHVMTVAYNLIVCGGPEIVLRASSAHAKQRNT